MITPEYLNEIMYSVEDKLSEVNENILAQIIKRIVQAFENGEGNLFIPATIHDMQKLINAGVLYEDIQQAVEKALPDISGAIKDAFYEAAGEISAQNYDIARQITRLEGLASVEVPAWEQSGVVQSAEQLGMTRAELRFLESAYRRTNGEMRNLTRTTASRAQQVYINACDKAYMKAQSGISVQKAVVDAIKEVSDAGVECVKYRNRPEKIEVAIARAVRTGVNQANGDIVMMRCAEMGVGFVKTSLHLGARVTAADDYTNHSWWQGRVFSINWNDGALVNYINELERTDEGFEWLKQMREELKDTQLKYDYPDFIENCGYGNILGICGINCRHSFYPFHPGIQLDDDDRPDMEENEKRYRLEQQARAMERAIRETKRELAGLKASGRDDDEFKKAKRETRKKLQEQSDKYMEFCQKHGLKPRNMALKISEEGNKKSGALNRINDPTGEKRDAHAIRYYKELANRKTDSMAEKMSNNTGLSLDESKQVYDYIFKEKHLMENGELKKYDPDYYMAQSFQRIIEGKNIQPHDLTLLRHELLESNIMREYNTYYEKAHAMAQEKYNYSAELDKYLNKEGR